MPIPQGFNTVASDFVDVELGPHPVTPFLSPGMSVTLPLVNGLPSGTVLQLLRVNPANGTFIPAISVAGAYVYGSVGADGLSVSFTGIASLSTVAALVPNGVFGDVNGDGKVDCKDVSIVKASFGKRTGQSGFDVRADVNHDGIVNVNDLALVTRQVPAGAVCH